MHTLKNTKIAICLLLLITVMMVIMDFFDVFSPTRFPDAQIVFHTIFRFLCGILILLMLKMTHRGGLMDWRPIKKTLWIMIPAFVISINNFPFSAFFNGRTTWDVPRYHLYLFIVECLSVGFFEEIVFRGVLLLFLLNRWSKHKNGVLLSITLSSFVFGIAHLLNISSLGIDLMILQVGYSFLMGMMWSVMFLRTRNLWMVILMHASYNFFGQVLFTMGTVNQRFDMLTIWITVLLAILVAIHTVIQLFYIRLENLNISGFEVRSS
jgi:hypothetical protein